MTRILCLSIPLFPLAARLRSEPELSDEAVAVCEGNDGAARVVAATRRARVAGVRPGMGLSQARALLPRLIARGRDAVAEAAAREALMEAAGSVSPRVEDTGGDTAFAEVSGMERLFPGPDGEQELAAAAVRTARQLQLPVRAGLAASKLAARVAAGFPPTVVPAGSEAAFLAPLPLERLEADARILETLHRWGIRRVGELARLPAGEVTARLGPAGLALHRAARGIDPGPLVPSPPPAVLGEGMELEWPVVALAPFLAALEGALERLRGRLERQGQACAVLEVELVLEPEGTVRRTVHLPAPTVEVATLSELVRLELEAHPPGGPVTAFTCLAHPGARRRAQLTLFGPAEVHPDRLATAVARLAARLGPGAVGSPRPLDDHRPEAVTTVPFDPPPPPTVRRSPCRGRGLLAVRVLRPPVPLEVITRHSSAPCAPAIPVEAFRPVSLQSESGAAPRIQGLVRVAAGPWRLEEGWWRDDPSDREYWDVELAGGDLYRIYRDAGSGDWFADGLYD